MVEDEIMNLIENLFTIFIDTFGFLGLPFSILVFIIIMIIQAIIAPIASEAILAGGGGILFETFGNIGIYAAIFGGIVGSLLGAWIAFYISRYVQKILKVKIIDKYNHEDQPIYTTNKEKRLHQFAKFSAKFIDEDSDDFIDIIEKYGFIIVLLGRMIVLIPFDVISYAAGLTRIKFKDYMIATFIGTIPRVTFYVFVGIQFANAIEDSNFALFIGLFTGFVGAIYLFYTFLKKSLNNK